MKLSNTTWYQGKRLKEFIEHSTQAQINIPHLAVAIVLAAKDQGKTLEDIVHDLILANDYESLPRDARDTAKTLKELGF